MVDRLKFSPDCLRHLKKGQLLWMAFLAWSLTGCAGNLTYMTTYPDLDADTNCHPVLTDQTETNAALPGIQLFGENGIYTNRDSIAFECDDVDSGLLISVIGGVENEKEISTSPLVVELGRDGRYIVSWSDRDCGMSTIHITNEDGREVGREAGELYCETDTNTFEIIKDTIPPAVVSLAAGVSHASLAVDGIVVDEGGQPVILRGQNNGKNVEPTATLPGQVFRFNVPLNPGKNQITLEACDRAENCRSLNLSNETASIDYNPAKDIVLEKQQINPDGSFDLSFLVPDLSQSLDLLAQMSPQFQQESLLFGNNWTNNGECEEGLVQPDSGIPGLNRLSIHCQVPRRDGKTMVTVSFKDKRKQTFNRSFLLVTEDISLLERAIARGATGAGLVLALTGLAEIGRRGYKRRKERILSERTQWFNDVIIEGNLTEASVVLEEGGLPKNYSHLLEAGVVLGMTEHYLQGTRLREFGTEHQKARQTGYAVSQTETIYTQLIKQLGKGFYRPEEKLMELAGEVDKTKYTDAFTSALPLGRATELNKAIYLLGGLYYPNKQPAPMIEEMRTQVFLDLLAVLEVNLSAMVMRFETGELDLSPLGSAALSREYTYQVLMDKTSWFSKAVESLQTDPVFVKNVIFQRRVLAFQALREKASLVFIFLSQSWEKLSLLDSKTLEEVLILLYKTDSTERLSEILRQLPNSHPAKQAFMLEVQRQFASTVLKTRSV